MIKQAPFTNAGTSGIKHIDATSRHKRKQEDITYNYIIFHNEDIKITAYNESGNWSVTEGWQPYTDPEANFSLIGQHAQTWQDAQAFSKAISPLASQGSATLHHPTYGDILYELGDAKRFGAYHVMARRMAQGFTEEESARIAVLVGLAAQKGKANLGQKNKAEIDWGGIRAVVAIDKNGNKVITGFTILNNKYRKKDKKENADESTDALSSQQSYATDGLNSVQQWGAALERSIQWLNNIVKKYPEDFEDILTSRIASKIQSQVKRKRNTTLREKISFQILELQISLPMTFPCHCNTLCVSAVY